MRGINVMTESRADSGHLIRGDRGSNAGTADQNALFHLAFLNGASELFSVIGIIDRLRSVCAQVINRLSFFFQVLNDFVLELETRMIRCDGDLHEEAFSV